MTSFSDTLSNNRPTLADMERFKQAPTLANMERFKKKPDEVLASTMAEQKGVPQKTLADKILGGLGAITGAKAVGEFAGKTILEGVEVAKDIGQFARTGELREREELDAQKELSKGAAGAAMIALPAAGRALGASGVGQAVGAGLTRVSQAGKAGRAAEIAGRAGITSGAGATEGALFGVAEDEDITTSAIIGGIAPVALGTGAKIVSQLGQGGKKVLEKALKLRPSSREKVASILKEGAVTGVDTAEDYLLKRGVAGSSKNMIKDLSGISTEAKKALDGGIGNITKVYRLGRAKQALKQAEEFYSDIPGKEVDIKRVKELQAKQGNHTLSELLEVKRILDDLDVIFKKSGEAKAGARSQGLAVVRRDIREFIEDKATEEGFPVVRRLNAEIRIAKELEEAVRKREGVSKGIIGLIGTVAGGSAFAGTGGDLKTAAGVAGLAALMANPASAARVASAISKLDNKAANDIADLIFGKATEQQSKAAKKAIEQILKGTSPQ